MNWSHDSSALAQKRRTRGYIEQRAAGATASAGPPAGRRALSLQRAEAVKSVLVREGVPAAAITTSGVGTDWARHVPDLDTDGNLLPGPAAQNRMVLVELSR